jgi:hypothetical protein
MSTQPLLIVQGVVRGARDLTTVRDGRKQVFARAVELLTEAPIPDGAGGFLEVTCFVRDGELLPSHTIGEQVQWVVSVEPDSYKGRVQIRSQFVSELSIFLPENFAEVAASVSDSKASAKV